MTIPTIPRKLAAGDRVAVYRLPLTREKKEGDATLVRRVALHAASAEQMEFWTMRFDGDTANVDRWVSDKDRLTHGGYPKGEK